MGVVVPFKASQNIQIGLRGYFTGKTALRCSIAGDAEVTTPRGAEDGCRARRPASSAGTAIAECQVDCRSSNSSRLKARREVQQAQQTQTRSGHLPWHCVRTVCSCFAWRPSDRAVGHGFQMDACRGCCASQIVIGGAAWLRVGPLRNVQRRGLRTEDAGGRQEREGGGRTTDGQMAILTKRLRVASRWMAERE